ncbi:DNA-binding NarL/FixJ family response regulator [Nocardioides luteus]|uniref:DNA-binding response regulator n=1 Tax=Nocardioides luteus TaxID=1844 RepID=A0ABQ5SR15_9ACTN|nr:response regulator transcription factor [Nocardioides luteus]MDR7312932.1 DNA-binding NarL/FixJ family response regulator [Nocardioides luteus]GGR45267.1 DNA-binding response regulator [Nocardioides luteus]GLJ65993.1 DNA-binding response regulator [Nocardioides luteus]
MTRVLLADDQDLVRAGLRMLLGADPDLEVVGEARDGDQAVARCRELRPDVVLMDVRMPGTGGIEATRRIREDPELVGIRVLILTTFDDDEDVLEAIRLGAAGYLLKDTGSDDLRRAVRTVAGGGNLLSPEITRRVMEHLAAAPRQEPPEPRLAELTERELAVLRRIALGETNAEIAAVLHISHATARTYVSRILTKLQARDRTQLAVIALNAGLG